MSRGGSYARFNAAARHFLEADIGPVAGEDCAVDACDDSAVFRVPWPSVGGDIAYCGYHLARYHEQHPDLFDRVQDVVDEDLTALATRGDRFLTFDTVPETLFDETFEAIALLSDGTALYEEREPGEDVTYSSVDRRLEVRDQRVVDRAFTGEFLAWVDENRGVHEWSDDVVAALHGGEQR
jgi:hypothetical protein